MDYYISTESCVIIIFNLETLKWNYIGEDSWIYDSIKKAKFFSSINEAKEWYNADERLAWFDKDETDKYDINSLSVRMLCLSPFEYSL